MTAIRCLTLPLLSAAIVSCASRKTADYDTPGTYGAPDAGYYEAPANPVYDTPPAYEEAGAVAERIDPIPADPGTYTAPTNGSAIIHTVVKGDTLSGLSSKYNVPMESIKSANRMTNDTVVLGRKMVIPPR